MSTKSS
jgi:N-acetylneuraminic acid mutarotase